MKFRFDEIAFNSTLKKKPVEEDKIHYIGLEHIEPGNFSITEWGSDVAPVGEKLIMKKGDILFGKRRAYQRKVAIAPFDGIFSAHGMVLRPKTDVIDADFFPLFISSDTFMETAMRISVGGLSPTINWKDLKEQEFELPSLEEQQTIAKKAWAAYRLKEAYQRLLVATDEMVKSQFLEWFGNPFLSPKNGESVSITDVADIVLGTTPNSKIKEYWDGELKWITPAEIEEESFIISDTVRHITEYGRNSANLTLLPVGSVLFSTRAPIGKVAIAGEEMYCNQGFKNFICKPELNNVFLYYTLRLNKEYLVSLGTGTTFKELSKKIVESIKISVPAKEQQEQFERVFRQSDKSKFDGFKSQFLEWFGNVTETTSLSSLIAESYPGEWGKEAKNNNGVKVLRTTNFQNNGHIDYSDVIVRYIEQKKIEKKCLRTGDIILERSGGTKDNPVGRVVLFEAEGEYMFNNFTQLLRPIKSVNPYYLFFYLHTSYNADKASMRAMASQTTGIQNLNMTDYMAKEIPLPSLEEQEQFERLYRQVDKSKYYEINET